MHAAVMHALHEPLRVEDAHVAPLERVNEAFDARLQGEVARTAVQP